MRLGEDESRLRWMDAGLIIAVIVMLAAAFLLQIAQRTGALPEIRPSATVKPVSSATLQRLSRQFAAWST